MCNSYTFFNFSLYLLYSLIGLVQDATYSANYYVLIEQGCAHFPEFLQNFSERQILLSLCSVVFHAFTLKLPIQTSLSVVPKLPVSLRSGENFSKTSTSLRWQNKDKTIELYLKHKNARFGNFV